MEQSHPPATHKGKLRLAGWKGLVRGQTQDFGGELPRLRSNTSSVPSVQAKLLCQQVWGWHVSLQVSPPHQSQWGSHQL